MSSSKKLGTFGPVTKKLSEAWIAKLGSVSSFLPESNVQALFNDLNLYPSKSQVFEMVRCARESTLIKEDGPDFLTFGEFSIFATELSRLYALAFGQGCSVSSCLTAATAKSGSGVGSGSERSKAKKVELIRSGKSSAYDVFLGGSCNPTTWRQDIAIPYFKSQGITYYNPQQANWVPEMIELEHQAKQTSQILFFVLNEFTRNVVSMIEVSYMAGQKRRLIVMINPYPGPGHKINDDILSGAELNDLENALATVHDLVERQGAPVFSSIQAAMSCTAKVIKESVAIEDLGLKDNAQPVKLAHIQIGDILVRLREAFDTLDTSRNGKISIADMKMAFRIHTHKDLPQKDLRLVIEVLQHDRESNKVPADQLLISFEDFCKVVSEFQQTQQNGETAERTKIWDSLAVKTSRFIRCIVHPFSGRHRRHILQQQQQQQHPRAGNRENSLTRTLRDRRGSSVRDVYLGGSMDPMSKWRDEIAIPALKKNGLTFFNPQPSYEAMALYSRRLLPIEAGSMDNSRVLLFVILGSSLSVKAMCEAAYHIGLGRNIVLCIEKMSDPLIIGGSQLSTDALKDYNRGRTYLSDIANREGMPIFDSIEEAVACVVQKCKCVV